MNNKKPELGLRERKKSQMRIAIQSHALRLFREQSYDTTTVANIAAAADISEATFFRYFPSKEDVVVQDGYNSALVAILETQTPELNPFQALRATFQQAFSQFSATEYQEQYERIALIMSVPKLRARMLDQLACSMQLLTEPLAKRAGRHPDDFAILTIAGAAIGVGMAVMETLAIDPRADLAVLLDTALSQIEHGVNL